ncbi:hypothetical protein JT359_18370 [Candidatus Poribacteria bacterium]|nr:hypothetical protein [Candidatus Poribacteria bacterium]
MLLLSSGHLFGVYDPIQIAEALSIPKANLYHHLKGFSVYQWISLLVRIGCSITIQEIRETESESASTKSRRCITISVDDTNVSRYGKLLSYCYNWWSKKHNSTIQGQDVLGITIKIGKRIIPLKIRIVGKQWGGNTDKPNLFNAMLKEVLDFFDAQGIDLRQYPITFVSWYGSKRLIQNLSEFGFDRILFHGKSNYMMEINHENIKLSQHKKQIKLNPQRLGCNKPHYCT